MADEAPITPAPADADTPESARGATASGPPRGARPTVSLTADQTTTLRVLGYLFLRMGQFERARRLFGAMAALDPADRWAQRNLAAAALAMGDGAAALDHLRRAVGDGMLPTADAVLYLLRARALWAEDRRDEARSAVEAYLAATEAAGANLNARTGP